MLDKLVIVSNESIFDSGDSFHCDNIDMKSIPEGLSNKFEICLIGRKSKSKKSHKINIANTLNSSNIFSFLLNIIKNFKSKNAKYLLISITPYTFFSYLLLIVFRKKVFLYIRSDGYKEYKYIIGFFGVIIYHLMFQMVSLKATLISARSHLLKGKRGKIVCPSQLNKKWFETRKKANLDKIELLYVGRIRIEKGIFSLLNIHKNLGNDNYLTIVSSSKSEKNISQKNVNVIEFHNENDSIISVYDKCNIFILPSFTEAHPQVVDESLARLRPVIVFEEIADVVRDRRGIFVSKRDPVSLSKTINYIIDNYDFIEKKIMENKLPTRENFIKDLYNIIKE
tara:strand:- start:48 stop:1064 length:1017 start_codon:yes stop_codon:yes gene_type:complete